MAERMPRRGTGCSVGPGGRQGFPRTPKTLERAPLWTERRQGPGARGKFGRGMFGLISCDSSAPEQDQGPFPVGLAPCAIRFTAPLLQYCIVICSGIERPRRTAHRTKDQTSPPAMSQARAHRRLSCPLALPLHLLTNNAPASGHPGLRGLPRPQRGHAASKRPSIDDAVFVSSSMAPRSHPQQAPGRRATRRP